MLQAREMQQCVAENLYPLKERINSVTYVLCEVRQTYPEHRLL